MPGAPNQDYINSPDGMRAAQIEFDDRRQMINLNRRYYKGDMRKPLEDDKDNVILNLCSDVVKQTVAFLLPDMPSLSLDDERQQDEDEGYLAEMWDANGGVSLLHHVATNGAIAGHEFIRIIPPAPDETGHEYPQLATLDPAHVIVWWRDDNHRRIWGYELRWGEPTSVNQKQRSYRQTILRRGGGWMITDYVGDARKNEWQQTNQQFWGYDLPPVVDAPHLPRPNSYYGAHEFEHAAINDAINAIVSDVKSIIRWHQSPTMFGTGFAAEGVKPTSVNGLYTVENENADLKTVEMLSDLSPAMDSWDRLQNMFYRLNRVVTLPSDLSAFRNMTNLGIRTAFMPQITKNETLRRSYSALISRASRVSLLLDNRDAPREVHSEFGSALPTDDAQELQILQQEMQMGIVSRRMAARRRGYDYDTVLADKSVEMFEDAIDLQGQPVGVSG